MNAYERRLNERKLKEKKIRNNRLAVTLIHLDQIVSAYERAYIAVFGFKPKVGYSHGWFKVGMASYREADLIQETRKLQARVHECELGEAT